MQEQKYPSEVVILQNITGIKQVKETHISYALIGDDYVYKIKKSVDFGFLDYRLAKSRRAFCILEKELNERFSKGVYLEVLKIVRISASDFALVPVENSLAAIEYVLKMKRIKDEDFLQNRIDNDKISCEDMEKIGRETALLLKDLEPAPKDEKFESVFEAVKFNAVENFNQTEKYVKNFINEDSFNYIQTQTLNFLTNNKDLFNKRSSDGFVKNGHGDLRLEHIYFNDDGSVGLIDCIEFNKRFRYNDAVSEAAFLSMELDSLGHIDLSDSFLSGFFSVFNDGESLKLLNYYRCYLAYVRAKVTCFLVDGKDTGWELYDEKINEIKKLIDMSAFYAMSLNGDKCLLFYGLMGTGKSKNADSFAKRFPARVFMSDILRKEAAGLDKLERKYIEWETGIYSKEASLNLYDRLGELAAERLKTGRISLIDASFSKKEYLDAFKKHNTGEIKYIKFTAPDDVVELRLKKREETAVVTDGRTAIACIQKKDASLPDADIEIVTTGDAAFNTENIFKYLIK